MARKVFLITDYKGNFGSKYKDDPYRSGFDKVLLSDLFREKGFEAKFINPQSTDLLKNNPGENLVVYTSQEDDGLFYKTYLEDIIFSLELSGSFVIPSYPLLRAHENKVFFETLRKNKDCNVLNNIKSSCFGTFEEFKTQSDKFNYPVVLKTHNGSMSRGVYLAGTKNEAENIVRKITSTKNLKLWLRDFIRYMRHKGYARESWNRKKFIVQEYIPGLLNDYKVLIYGSKYYVLHRTNKKGDFRASGQGSLSFTRDLPEGLLDFSEKCFTQFRAPQASFDIGFDGKEFYLFEGQFIYFGTYTIEFSDFCFRKVKDKWSCIEGKPILEREYVDSIIEFLTK